MSRMDDDVNREMDVKHGKFDELNNDVQKKLYNLQVPFRRKSIHGDKTN